MCLARIFGLVDLDGSGNAVHALALMRGRQESSSDDSDWSPPPDPLPIYQQRYNYLT